MQNQIITKLILFSFLFNPFALALEIDGVIDATHPLWKSLQNPDNNNILLKKNTLIIHEDKPFHLYAKHLEIEEGAKIVAFQEAALKGNDGEIGKYGLNAGQIIIEAINAYGTLEIDNKGQKGGDGGNGGNGAQGIASYDCVKRARKCHKIERPKIVYTVCNPKACVEHEWHCLIPSRQGGEGGKGGEGGSGGDVNIRIKQINELCLSLDLRGGLNGQVGKPGKGGKEIQVCSQGLEGKTVKYIETRNQSGSLIEQPQVEWIPSYINYPALEKWSRNKNKFPYSIFNPVDYGQMNNQIAKTFLQHLNVEEAKKAQGWTSQSYKMLLKIRKQWLDYHRKPLVKRCKRTQDEF